MRDDGPRKTVIPSIAAIAFPLKSLPTLCSSISVSLSACEWSRPTSCLNPVPTLPTYL